MFPANHDSDSQAYRTRRKPRSWRGEFRDAGDWSGWFFRVVTLKDLFDPDSSRVHSHSNSWAELVTALNELARSMGQPDFHPFIMSRPVLRKLHFIQLVVKAERDAGKA